MSTTAEITDVYSAIEESARLWGVACSRDTVWPVITAYEEVLAQVVIAFRVATGARRAGELDCRFVGLPKDLDPYAVALSNGLLTKTDHPVGALLADIQLRCSIVCYGIDFGVVGGFKKIWPFSYDLRNLSQLADIPSMPPSLAENADFFARYGLTDKGGMIGIDYDNRTVNVYFGGLPAECHEQETILSMHRELGLPEPSEQMLTLAQQAFGIYVTLSWDSPNIERITFAVLTPDPMTLPVRIDPKVEQFVRNAPYTASAIDRRFVYAVASSPKGEYNKLQSYYQWRPEMMKLLGAK